VLGIPTLLLFGGYVFDQLHRITSDARFDIAWSGSDRLASVLGTRVSSGVRTACTALAAVVALASLLRAWRGADPIAAAGWAFLALLASIASFAPWYLVWVLPLAAAGRSPALQVTALMATGYVLAVHLPELGGLPWLTSPGG
jgi:hypothetical protein